MNIVIGKIVNTFGIKGELKIVSNFEMASRAFKKGNKIIINNKERLITNSRFHHHNYLVEIDNIKDIKDKLIKEIKNNWNKRLNKFYDTAIIFSKIKN